MYGLTTRFAKVEMPIRKPWRVACLNTCLPEMLNMTCDGSHSHVPCEGRETLYTQGYTPAICGTIHHAIAEDIDRIRNRPAEPRAQVQRSDRCLNSHVVAASLDRNDRSCSLVFVDIGILLCRHFDSPGVDTPRPPTPRAKLPDRHVSSFLGFYFG